MVFGFSIGGDLTVISLVVFLQRLRVHLGALFGIDASLFGLYDVPSLLNTFIDFVELTVRDYF